ncbi:MAG TPA: hypothetical protein VN372_11665 [Methanospirillum sp.]|nr:hypothetical protein [Methanospirillum sp.]
MDAKPVPKQNQQKKPVKSAGAQKGQDSKATPSKKYDLQEIVDLHTTHLLHLDEMFSTLQGELQEIRSLVALDKGSKVEKDPTVLVEKSSPAKKGSAQKKPQSAKPKSSAVQTQVKNTKPQTTRGSGKKSDSIPAAAKTPKSSVKSQPKTPEGTKKPAKTLETQDPSEIRILIPGEIVDRINALTSQKKITQTQLGDETDLPQKVIYEISERKLKELSSTSILKITAVLKKYETK